MRTLMSVVILLLIVIVGVGFYRDWFQISTNSTDQNPSATITVDQNKIHEDEQKVKDKMQGFGKEAEEKTGNQAGNAKEPERRPLD